MRNDVTDAIRWMTDGHAYFLSRLASASDDDLIGASRLPGWSGRHVLSHVGHNARALGRLAHWAATGERTPMYPDPQARIDEIESGAQWPVRYLREFVDVEQNKLAEALASLTDAMWHAEVVTAQGRVVPASTVPWLRSREVWVHACDLPSGGDFAHFPADFLDALIDDALARRAAQSVVVNVSSRDRTTEFARWLTGRGEAPRTNSPLPDLPPWL
ncbi:maleylpyruvate isomerase family mycothiol-dependent enzyme [Kibdelosporangium philippinense]|uniref:Maleylpyruvate isomerase family mycothiol-dependent enzyme n=1 Tax=Kibdelosporangium philippinense TaxID=211113 RepID=A0ABS8ZEJ2_9PSEU|nr:maleylpyruvate isomerase family mycothiol-dependent enzyme [Kibdelosporangium philippinense]MCE7004257.1 maleylpyruvate isomerase family mycothiol-dependent enzyme [Kibdelosporangium philippinense]